MARLLVLKFGGHALATPARIRIAARRIAAWRRRGVRIVAVASAPAGLTDRLLGCGTLVISDATDKAGVTLHDVPRVEQVQVVLHDLLFSADDGSDDGEFPPREPRRRLR